MPSLLGRSRRTTEDFLWTHSLQRLLLHHVSSRATKSGDFLISCLGNSEKRGKVFPNSEIQSLFLSEDFRNIVEASFASLIRRHQAEFRYCQTPDCDQVYRVSSPGKVPLMFTCAACFTPTCTACHVSHPGISCSKNKGNNADDIEELIDRKSVV